MRSHLTNLLYALAGAALLMLLISSSPAATASPTQVQTQSIQPARLGEANAGSSQIHYQGRLLNPVTGQAKPDGSYTMVFSIYAAESGGTALWTESKNVLVNKGLFGTLLGDTTFFPAGLFTGEVRYLGIAVGGDPEAVPRQQIASVAHAIFASTAGDANSVEGKAAADFAAAAHSHDERYFLESEADNRFINASGIETIGNNSNRSPILTVLQKGTNSGLVGIADAPTIGHAGVVGIGESASGSRIDSPSGVLGDSKNQRGVIGISAANDGVLGFSTGGSGTVGQSIESYGVDAFSQNSYAIRATSQNSYAVHASSPKDHAIYAEGAVYGLYTPDKVFAGSGYNDLAEHIPAASNVEAGEVVVIDPNHDERVIKSTQPNDPTVAGVISTDPAMLIGQADTPSPLALAGRVPVKVSDENGPIQRGDLLTTSSMPGHAMKAQPTIINGMPFYQPGTIIGKALGELEMGTGVITVLIQPR